MSQFNSRYLFNLANKDTNPKCFNILQNEMEKQTLMSQRETGSLGFRIQNQFTCAQLHQARVYYFTNGRNWLENLLNCFREPHLPSPFYLIYLFSAIIHVFCFFLFFYIYDNCLMVWSHRVC